LRAKKLVLRARVKVIYEMYKLKEGLMLWASSMNGVLSELKEWCSERANEGALSEQMKVL